jgi:signal peptidase II
MRKNSWWLVLSVIVVILDQVSKCYAVEYLHFGESLRVLPFFSLTISYNPGAAFSFLGTAGGWQVYLLTAISIVMSVILLVWLLRFPSGYKIRALGVSLVLGGAVGNLIDRIRLNYVIDFLDFHLKTWHYPIFNLADTAISIGAILLIWSFLFTKRYTPVD